MEKGFLYLSANGKDDVHAYIWEPDGEVKGVVQISHGMCEHALRYREFAQYLTSKGFVVCANDHLGHGATAKGNLGYMGDDGGYKHMVDDIHGLCSAMKKKYNKPYILLGHSMGSFLARYYFEIYGKELDGLILSGTGEGNSGLYSALSFVSGLIIKMGGGRRRAAFVTKLNFGQYNKAFAPIKTSSDWLSSDSSKVDEFVNDKLCQFMFTYYGYRDLLNILRFITRKEWAKNVPKELPIYIFSGDKDPVGGAGKGVEQVYSKLLAAGCNDVTLRLYPNGRHEMLNETNRKTVYEDVYNWLSRFV